MGYTMGEAARMVGKSKTSMARAIASGRLSAERLADGSYSIEGVELARAFPPVTETTPSPWSKPVQTDTVPVLEVTGAAPQAVLPQVEVAELRIKAEMLVAQLAREQETVADLRARLDAAQEHVARLALALPAPVVVVPPVEPAPAPASGSVPTNSDMVGPPSTIQVSPAPRGGLLAWLLGRR